MATQKLLLPYNFKASDRKALAFTIRTFAHREDVEVTLFHSYTPLPTIDISNETVTGRLKESFSYLNQKLSELEMTFEEVKEELVENGFDTERVKSTFKPRKKEIANEIIDLHKSEKFSFLVLNRKVGRIGRFFSGSVHTKVIAALRNATVCIVC
jgi:uncharacterized protein (UPF0335 family)